MRAIPSTIVSNHRSEQQNAHRSMLRRLAIYVLLVVVCLVCGEVFLFNAAFWRTRHIDSAESMNIPVNSQTSDIKQLKDGVKQLVLSLPRRGNVYTLRIVPRSNIRAQKLSVEIEAGGSWHAINDKQIITNVVKTQYSLMQYGDVSQVRLQSDSSNKLQISEISVNTRVPFVIDPIRIVIEIALAVILYLLLPFSALYRHPISDKPLLIGSLSGVGSISVLLAWLFVLIAGPLMRSEPAQGGLFWSDPHQYNYLADALLHGHTWLDLPVPHWLAHMSNPYDATERARLALASGDKVYWDYAFYQGKYYTYFGVIPALVLYLPYQAITHQYLPTWVACGVFATLFIIGSCFFVVVLLRHWFANTSSGIAVLSSMAFILGSNVFIYCFNAQFYAVPMLASLAFTVWGLYFWISAFGKEHSSDSWWRIAVGTVFIAANAGCRPQFLVSGIVIVCLLWPELVSRTTSWKDRIRAVLCVIIPGLIVVIPLCLYNQVRFGSPFDFGATYNLTGFDMTKTKLSLYTMPGALLLQLFQPAVVTADFPFLSTTQNTILGPHEQSIGGLFALYPILLILLFLPAVSRLLRDISLKSLAWCLIVIPLPVIILDLRMCGISNRYYGDYSWMGITCAVIIVAALENNFNRNISSSTISVSTFAQVCHKILIGAVLVLVLISLSMIGLGVFTNGYYPNLAGNRPEIYAHVASWFLSLE